MDMSYILDSRSSASQLSHLTLKESIHIQGKYC